MTKEYVTAESGGLGWRAISKKMESEGQNISPSGARSLFMNTMEKIARELIIKVKGVPNPKLAKKIARNPKFHAGVSQILEFSNGK